jgi:hypothetical protein
MLKEFLKRKKKSTVDTVERANQQQLQCSLHEHVDDGKGR